MEAYGVYRSVACKEYGESVEFPGMCVVALANDANRMKYSGCILTTGDMGITYGLKDIDGNF